MENNKLGFDTLMVHAGYSPDSETMSATMPIYQTNSYSFKSAKHAKALFELKESGNIYSRMQNPTNDILENRVNALEGGVGALSFSSGHAAISSVMFNLAGAGDEIISASTIYGGAINLFGVSLKKLGINVKFVNSDNPDEFGKAISDKTKAIFVETVGNPNANIPDFEKIADIAHKNGIPLVVDSTFTTPYLLRPIEFGADIIIHSSTKFLGGHGASMGGLVIDCGTFNWEGNPRFKDYNTPDASYHGVIYAKDMGKAAFITKLRVHILRDFGACAAPFNSFLIAQGVETLSLRMRKHCDNALEVAKFLENNPKISFVNYPGLSSSKYYELAQKYLPKGAGAVFTFGLNGGREAGIKFIDSLKLIKNIANVGDVRTMVIHPATTTHSQLSEEQLIAAGISADTVRLSVGIEDTADIINDLEQAINKA